MNTGERAALQRDLAALARGDRDAFDPVFHSLWPLLRGFAGRFLPSQEAEDVAQEAILRVFSRASEFDVKRDALSWALGIAAWQVRTHRKRAQRRREDSVDAILEREDRSPTPEATAMAGEVSVLLDRALAEMSPSEAATLVAYARGDRPDLPGPTFRKRVQRALTRLRALWRIDHDSV